MPEDIKHSLSKRGQGEATRRFKVESDCITFRRVRVEDSGTYTISCCTAEGEVSQETLELEVTPPQPPTLPPQGNTQAGKDFMCMLIRS